MELQINLILWLYINVLKSIFSKKKKQWKMNSPINLAQLIYSILIESETVH